MAANFLLILKSVTNLFGDVDMSTMGLFNSGLYGGSDAQGPGGKGAHSWHRAYKRLVACSLVLMLHQLL